MSRPAWGYVRASTKRQATSCDTQQAAIAQWCRENDYPLQSVFEDFGYSGALNPSGRPGLSALLDKVRNGDAVVYWAQDRLSRHEDALKQIEEALKGRDIELVNIDSVTRGNKAEARLAAAVLDQLELCPNCEGKAHLLVMNILMHNGKTVL
jgi:DNA invertase Pin-like site-specific DNA recombinase